MIDFKQTIYNIEREAVRVANLDCQVSDLTKRVKELEARLENQHDASFRAGVEAAARNIELTHMSSEVCGYTAANTARQTPTPPLTKESK